MSKLLEFYETGYKSATAASAACPEVKAAASKWLSIFQKNSHAHMWPEVCAKLLLACEEGKMELVKECWWTSMIGAELAPDSLPAVVAWGMKQAAGIDHIQEMYDLLNVKLTVDDIKGESFYGGFPSPTENDKKLGAYLNQIEDLYLEKV